MDIEFENIKNEAVRQLQALFEASNSNDRKIEVIFGIALTIFGYIFSQQSFLNIFKSSNYPLIILFCFGLALVIQAVFIGYRSFKCKWHPIGPSTKEMYDKFKEGEKNTEEILLYNINHAIGINQPLQEKKWKSVNQSLQCLGLGVLIIIVTRLIFFFSM